MKVTTQDVERVAAIARLELTDTETEKYAVQLSAFMEYADRMDGVDAAGIPPMTHVFPDRPVLREDEVRPSLSREKALKNAPEADENCFIVPKII